jgi:hypothetical protein
LAPGVDDDDDEVVGAKPKLNLGAVDDDVGSALGLVFVFELAFVFVELEPELPKGDRVEAVVVVVVAAGAPKAPLNDEGVAAVKFDPVFPKGEGA